MKRSKIFFDDTNKDLWELLKLGYAKIYPHNIIRFEGGYRYPCPFQSDYREIFSQVCKDCKHCVKVTDSLDQEEGAANSWELNYVHCDYMLGQNYVNAFE